MKILIVSQYFWPEYFRVKYSPCTFQEIDKPFQKNISTTSDCTNKQSKSKKMVRGKSGENLENRIVDVEIGEENLV